MQEGLWHWQVDLPPAPIVAREIIRDPVIIFKRPRTKAIRFEEEGDWHSWREWIMITRTSDACPPKKIAAILFEDGSVWETYNGWGKIDALSKDTQ